MTRVPRMVAALLGAAALACALPPLRNRMEPGIDGYAVFAARSPESPGDLYATGAGGGAVIQLTFSLPMESGPVLSPDGLVIAFFRQRDAADSLGRQLRLLNLLNGREREVPLPKGMQAPSRLAWEGTRALLVRAEGFTWRASVPPEAPSWTRLDGSERVRADSAFLLAVGTPSFARVEPCAGGGICAVGVSGAPQVLHPTGHDPARWGRDSIAFFVDDRIVVRAVGPSRPRELKLDRAPREPTSLSFFPGTLRRRPNALEPD
ncbi:MAG: hypothetical protein NW201_02710 [Gemmatimonadales bacterium]|nr:hypothetical protein [Gemmatimonadales bacterium]